MEQNYAGGGEAGGAEETAGEWGEVREGFAGSGEAIGEAGAACELVEKWVWINHEEEFRNYEQQLVARGSSVKQLVAEQLAKDRQNDWKLSQKYTMQQVQAVIDAVRWHAQTLLKDHQLPNPEHTFEETGRQSASSEKKDSARGNEAATSASMFPLIKPRGKVYEPEDLSSSFHLLKQTEQQYHMRSPYMFLPSPREQTPTQRPSLLGSKYLRMAFKHFCKQSYNTKGLFGEYEKEADKMNLNKWMVFCKEFNFTDKFSKKEIIEIFHTAGKFSTTLLVEDFLNAVAILQQKHIHKFRTGENFVDEVLQINSEAAFRVRMANCKVNYGGPTRNSFEYATYSESARLQQKQKEKEFQVKKREKEVVLIKGMFESHLKDEISKLKTQREMKKANPNVGRSMIITTDNERDKSADRTAANLKISRLEKLNYSKIYNMGKSQTARKDDSRTTNSKTTDTQLYSTALNKSELKNKSALAKPDLQKIDPAYQTKQPEKAQQNPQNKAAPQRQWVLPARQEQSMWLTKVRTDSEQSDQILKQHLEIEKKIQISRQSLKVKSLMQELQEKAGKVEEIRKQMEREKEEEDLRETGQNFMKSKEKAAIH